MLLADVRSAVRSPASIAGDPDGGGRDAPNAPDALRSVSPSPPRADVPATASVPAQRQQPAPPLQNPHPAGGTFSLSHGPWTAVEKPLPLPEFFGARSPFLVLRVLCDENGARAERRGAGWVEATARRRPRPWTAVGREAVWLATTADSLEDALPTAC
jgi:hypothetical protein